MKSASAKMPRNLFSGGYDAESTVTAYVGARRPCKALLGRCVRKLNARSVLAQTITAS